ncbi:ninjurin-2-like [Parasteatoda tepidariorum]|uniref:ninjurin-2-like n=1 Tax=Parasteatoda tepidariorum TaxID=114398 RepID=UPI00077FDFA8|nr:uncharacterized protein LOC107454267 [Parasteatoda tepidariorum]
MNRNSCNQNDIHLENFEKKTAEEKTKNDDVCLVCSLQTPFLPSSTDEKKKKEVVPNPLITRRISIAGGFLDIALFSANCEQLKFVLELGNLHIYYNEVLGLIIASLVLQLLVGLTLFLMGCQISKEKEVYSNVLNHTTMGLVAIITIINLFIHTFGPKGTVMARCLGAFAYANTKGSAWLSYVNHTWHYMNEDI